MKFNKDYLFTALKHLVLFALLMCATLLLLEVPALYYKKADGELLQEKGSATYQLKSVNKNFILFSEKVKLFQSAYANFALGDFTELTEAEIIEAEEQLVEELTEMFGEYYEPVISKLEQGEFDTWGLAVPVMDYSDEQVQMWDIGVLLLSNGEGGWECVVIYDGDSGKIFVLSCNTPGGWKDTVEEVPVFEKYNDSEADAEKYVYETGLYDLFLERIKAYYDGVEVVLKENVLYFGDSVFVSPFTGAELERSSLLWEIEQMLSLYGVKY